VSGTPQRAEHCPDAVDAIDAMTAIEARYAQAIGAEGLAVLNEGLRRLLDHVDLAGSLGPRAT